jgi:hypothetical protein
MPIAIMKMHVERFQSAQYREADAASRDGPDMHALDIIGPRYAVGDVPAALHHPLIRGNVD